MIVRKIESLLLQALREMPVVGLLGPRQVGKTTLALHIAELLKKETTYLDLELDSDLFKLSDTEAYLRRFDNQLLIIDEVQIKPELFSLLRGLVDIRKRKGEKGGQFLLLGSASRDLVNQSAETLAGRIRYLELSPFTTEEIFNSDPINFNIEQLWFRGGFPDSYLASTDEESWRWRTDFIATYVERDIPLMGPKVSATRMKTFWSMLAHYHGQQIDLSSLGRSLEVSHTTIRSYLDILTDFYMVRQIKAWSGNTKKRLVKSPKIYIRDTGLLHRLLNISGIDDLFANPVVGASWEGFVVENIIAQLADTWQYSYYRSATQAEIDLVLEGPRKEVIAIEIKRSPAPVLSKGFYAACDDVKATQRLVIYGGSDRFPLTNGVEAVGIIQFLKMMATMS